MSWVTCEPKSTMRILSWPASRTASASRTRGESRRLIEILCARRTRSGQGRYFIATRKTFRPPHEHGHIESIGVGAARRHQQPLFRDQRGLAEERRALLQHARKFDRRQKGEIALAS